MKDTLMAGPFATLVDDVLLPAYWRRCTGGGR